RRRVFTGGSSKAAARPTQSARVDLERSTLAAWVGRAAALLDPPVKTLRRDVLSSDVLHGDDTPVPVLAPGLGKTRTGRLWTTSATADLMNRNSHRRPHSSTHQIAKVSIPRRI